MTDFLLVVCSAAVLGHPHVCKDLKRIRFIDQPQCEKALSYANAKPNVFAFCRPVRQGKTAQ